jgi:hypothetical protein
MNFAATLSLVALVAGGSPPAAQDQELTYGSAVTFAKGKCRFWTGDVGLSADQFRRVLENGFDRRHGLFISHAADTPARCIRLAVRAAKRAGFKSVEAVVDPDAGAIAPPFSGS